MITNWWVKYEGRKYITTLSETGWRLTDEQDATRKLVDSLSEQILMDELIETTKLQLTNELSAWHPLLYSPFRAPPLQHGSRFGSRFEHALWYGSLQLATSMAEKAFYRFNFLRASKAKFAMVVMPLIAFSVPIKTSKAIHLTQSPFSNENETISSPISYQTSQLLGTAMRQAQIESFIYQSARDPQQRTNIALFTPKAFAHKRPNSGSLQSWQCISNTKTVEFIRSNALTTEARSFAIETFLVNNELPFPAS